MADLIDLENMIYAIAEAHKNGAEINFSERAVQVLAEANAVRIEMINEMCEGIDPEQCDEQLFIQLVSNRRELFDKFYAWLDGLSQAEYDDMSLTDKCEKFFFKLDK